MPAKPDRPSRTAASAAIAAFCALSACSSTQDVLEPSAITPPATIVGETSPTSPVATPQQVVEAEGPITSSTMPAAPPKAASLAALSAAKIQFAPIVGTSVEAATALSGRLSTRARARGIRLTGITEAPTHVLRGYFTPLVEGRETTVIFVWDVYDPNGNRVHRISGQQKSQTAGGEAWSAVPGASMQAVADTTIDELAAWLAGSAG